MQLCEVQRYHRRGARDEFLKSSGLTEPFRHGAVEADVRRKLQPATRLVVNCA
jgi:hypothetical protein